jgi:hypothetical protein
MSKLSLSPRLIAAPAAVVLAAAIAGCGDTVIDQEKAEKLVVDNITGGQVEPESASCPADVKAEKGKTFDCTVAFPDGEEGTVTVHITSDDGDVEFGQEDFKPPAE